MALRQTIPRRFPEYAFCVYGMLLLSRAVMPVIEGVQTGGRDMSSQSTLFSVLLAMFYTIVVGLLYKHRKLRQIWTVLRQNQLLTMMLILLAVSVIWSVEPAFTIRRVVALLGTTLFGIYLATCLQPRQVLVMLVVATLIGALLSVGFAALNPQDGIHHARGGGLRGVYQHQNTFGVAMALGFAAAVTLVILQGGFRLFNLVSLILLTPMLWVSQAATAILIGGLLLGLLPVLALVRRKAMSKGLIVTLGLVLLTAGSVAAAVFAETILYAVGRELTLSGRTFLWSALIDMINETRPWLGYGYGAFWYNEAATTSLYHQYPGAGWGPKHAHSGSIEAILDVGYVGFALFAMLVLASVRRAIRCTQQDRRQAWPLALLVMLLLADVQNSIILDHAVFWAVFVYLNVTMGHSLRAAEHSAPRLMKTRLALAPTPRTL